MDDRIRIAISLVVALVTGASMAAAQDPDSLRNKYLLPKPDSASYPTFYRAVPAITVLSPSGYGAEAGEVFGGMGFQARTRYTHQVDGAVAVGFGIGNASRNVGFETDLISYGTIRSGFMRHVAVSFKLSRLLSRSAGIAAGFENAFHSSGIDGDRSIFFAASNVFTLRHDRAAPFSEMTVTAGAGSGRFHSERTYTDHRNGIGGFGSLSFRVTRPVSAIADWSGQNLTLALSLAPFAHFPLVITPGVTDITRNSGDGARFIVGAGSGIRIRQLERLLGGNGDSK